MRAGKSNTLIKETACPAFVNLLDGSSSAPRLVCFHFAGGSAQSFIPWRGELQGKCELIAAELPGRSRRFNEGFLGSIDEAIVQFVEGYKQLDFKPSIFYGHSLGALLAYETARQLANTRYEPEQLILSSRSSPVSYPSHIGLPKLSDPDLIEYLKALNGTEKSVLDNHKLMEIMLPIIRSDLEIIYDYKHKEIQKLTIPVDIIGAIDDQHCPFETLLDWRNITTGATRVHMIEGGHFSPMKRVDHIFQLINRKSIALAA